MRMDLTAYGTVREVASIETAETETIVIEVDARVLADLADLPVDYELVDTGRRGGTTILFYYKRKD
jgi:hypothetical protein